MNRRKLFKGKNLILLFTALFLFVMISACGNSSSQEGEEAATDDSSSNTDETDNEEAEASGDYGDTESITFVAWGGTTQEAEEEAFGEPFTEETGIEVDSDNTDYGKFKAMVESGNVVWDVVDVEADFAYKAAEEGLLEELDFSVIDKSELDPDFVDDYFVGSFAYSFANAYNSDEITEEPQGWEDFFDLEKFPGKRTAYQWPTAGVFEMALLADGVDPDDLYPIDFDRAFAKLDEIKDSIQWWDTGAQSQQMLASGEVSMGHVWDGRMYPLIEEGAPVEIDWTHNIKAGDVLVVPKGTPNKEAAMKFIAIASSAEAQANMANMTSYTPINLEAFDLLDEELEPFLSSSNTDSQVVLDMEYWSTAIDEVLDDWNAWLLE